MSNNIDILLVGSSIIRNWLNINEYFSDKKIVNLGINGLLTIKMVNSDYLLNLVKYKPKYTIYYCGGNDIDNNIHPELIIKNIQLFIKFIKKYITPFSLKNGTPD
jgi:hypothetical protein